MATHEVAAGLTFSSELADLGVPVSASLGASFDTAFAPVQTLELAAALNFSSQLIAQRADQNLTVVPMIGGTLTEQEGRTVHVQPYKVKGLASGLDALQRLIEAREAPGVPLDKSAHPFQAGIQVIDRRVTFETAGETRADNSRAIVEVTWGSPLPSDLDKNGGASGGGVFSITPSTYTESTWFDKDGAIMRVTYQFIGVIFSRTVQADLQRQTWTATLTKEFSSPQYADIVRAGQINSGAFGPFAANTLLFLGPTLNETNEGAYSHGYQFTFNPDGWILRESVFAAGGIPDDATELFNPPSEPGGLGVFEIYQTFDFADLPVFFP